MSFFSQVDFRCTRVCLILILSIPSFTFAQRVTTVAGGSGDDGQALSADLFSPTTVAVDGSGNIFIADGGSRTIRRVDPQTGVITKFAGTGAHGNSGNGGLAINATFAIPTGVAVDVAGNVYVTDQLNSSIRKIDKTTGVITHIAGDTDGNPGFTGDNALASGARLSSPHTLNVDAAGNIYFTDSGNQRVRKINAATGIITTIAGNGTFAFSGDDGPATSASLSNPISVAVDANGNVYIADYQNFRIRRVNATSGIITTVAGTGVQGYNGDGGLAIQAQLDAPSGVLIDANGNLIISDTYNQRIRKVDLTTGIITTIAGTGTTGFVDGLAIQAQLNVPQGLAMDASGNVYFSEYVNRRVRKITGTTISTVAGNGGFDGDGGAATDASLKGPQGVAVDSDGNIYITDMLNNRIRKVDHTNGKISTIAGDGTPQYGGDGGPATSAQLYWPRSIILDKDGNLYFSDGANNSVRKINKTTGIITTVAGKGQFGDTGENGLATNATLYTPNGLVFDSQGNLLIVDQNNHKIKKVTMSTGIITTIAGNGTAGFIGDNGPAANAQLNTPTRMTVDANDNLLIVDSFNHCIRKVNAATNVITTLVGSIPNEQPMLPADVILQGDDLYILESHQLMKVNLISGVRTILAGSIVVGFKGDGGAALDAQFKYMSSFVRDQAGNFFIADTENNRIRKIAARVAQTLTFGTLTPKTFGDVPFELTASSTSGAAITYTSSGINVASVAGNTVTISGAGTTTITAFQPGDLDYLPSPMISQPLVVNKANQTITFTTVPTKTLGEPAFNLEAVSTSSLDVVYSATSDKISITGKQVSLSKAGRVIVKADQPGNSNYQAATTVEQSFCVNPAKPAITQTLGVSGIVLTSSNDSGNQWLLNGEVISGAVGKTFTAENVGTYTVKSAIDDCTSVSSEGVVLLITGLQDLSAPAALHIYPNPAEESLIVRVTSNYSEVIVLDMVDALGRSLSTKTGTTNEEIVMDVKKLSPGFYFVKSVSGTGQFMQRFIKK